MGEWSVMGLLAFFYCGVSVMEIIIDSREILHENINITGNIFFRIDNIYFPEENWNDFILIIVGNWINEYMSFLNSCRRNFTLYFMDGGFEIDGILEDSENIKLEYVRRYISEREIICTESVDKNDFEKQIIKACRKAMRIASTLNMTEQFNNFGKMLDKLKNL